jgi:hypothetical protein
MIGLLLEPSVARTMPLDSLKAEKLTNFEGMGPFCTAEWEKRPGILPLFSL